MRNKTIILLVVAAALVALFLAVRQGPTTADSRAPTAQSENPMPSSAAPRDEPQTADAPSDELTPEQIDALITASARITRGDGTVLNLRSLDGEFARVQVEPNEVLAVQLFLRDLVAGRGVLVEADHGGSINHRLGPLALQPKAANATLEFQYAVGGHPGKYTILVSQGGRQELLEFYVGPEQPRGQAGPTRNFTPDNT